MLKESFLLNLLLMSAFVCGCPSADEEGASQKNEDPHFPALNEESVDFYNGQALSLKEETYPRPASPDGVEWEGGVAAVFYQRALSQCDYLTTDFEDRSDDLVFTAYEQLRGQPPLKGTRDGSVIPEECRTWGVRGHDESRSDWCARVLDCQPALVTLRRGTRQRDARSPLHIWDMAKADEATLLPYIRLSRLELLSGYIAAIEEGPQPLLDSIHTVMTFANDLGNGCTLIGLMIAMRITDEALDLLNILTGQLSEDQAWAAYEMLSDLSQQWRTFPWYMRAEYLWSAPIFFDWFGASNVLQTPDNRNRGPQLSDTEIEQGVELMTGDLQLWQKLLSTPNATFAERMEVYRVHSEASLSNTLKTHDIRFTSMLAKMQAQRIILAHRALVRDNGIEPGTMSVVQSHTGAILDPFTLEAFEFQSTDNYDLVCNTSQPHPICLDLPTP